MTTPHNDVKATKLMGLSGDHFCAPNHQNYFNFKNLSSLLNDYNFNVTDYWMDNSIQFNLYAFFKRFLIQRDQITAFPPIKVSQRTIWKWQRDRHKSVILSEYDIKQSDKENQGKHVNTKKLSTKKRLKKIMGNVVPLKFRTHQIILAKSTL